MITIKIWMLVLGLGMTDPPMIMPLVFESRAKCEEVKRSQVERCVEFNSVSGERRK